ncbi:MAG: hypothetical protein WCJ41_04180 [Aestuariivirga sp.]|uniref:hypothetical protein n=1 Tax=Aestuariivirga sp. TaxID=2650926 RepID=UPI0030171E30
MLIFFLRRNWPRGLQRRKPGGRKFTASCPTGITVKSNGSGKVRINGTKATVKTFSATAWEARIKGIAIDFGMDGSALTVTYTAKGGANGICQVTSSAASGDAGGGANLTLAPAKDQEACLAAVSNKTNNGEVTVLDTNSSEANNTVIVGVGEQKAKWRCLVKNGRVADVMSLTDEGAL